MRALSTLVLSPFAGATSAVSDSRSLPVRICLLDCSFKLRSPLFASVAAVFTSLLPGITASLVLSESTASLSLPDLRSRVGVTSRLRSMLPRPLSEPEVLARIGSTAFSLFPLRSCSLLRSLARIGVTTDLS